MSSVFAFKVSTPVQSSGDQNDLDGWTYDPVQQSGVWVGGSTPFAVKCTRGYIGGYVSCNAYGSYCNTYNGHAMNFGYVCD